MLEGRGKGTREGKEGDYVVERSDNIGKESQRLGGDGLKGPGGGIRAGEQDGYLGEWNKERRKNKDGGEGIRLGGT